MSKWSDKFNELPKEIRLIGAKCSAETRIQHLKLELRRLRARYEQSRVEINDHIKNCERSLKDGDEEPA